MTQDEIRKVFAKVTITDDHFVYAPKEGGWYHGSTYINKNRIFVHHQLLENLCQMLAARFKNSGVQTVVVPTIGAVNLLAWMSYWLSFAGPEVLAVCADKEDVLIPAMMDERAFLPGRSVIFSAYGKVELETGHAAGSGSSRLMAVHYFEKTGTKRVIRRGYEDCVQGRKCLIIEDIIDSGTTVVQTRDAILKAGGKAVGVGALCNRSSGKVTAATLGVPQLVSLLDVDMEMFPEDNCPICKAKGLESVRRDLGHGEEFLIRKGIL